MLLNAKIDKQNDMATYVHSLKKISRKKVRVEQLGIPRSSRKT